jgi:hypothetical protein
VSMSLNCQKRMVVVLGKNSSERRLDSRQD